MADESNRKPAPSFQGADIPEYIAPIAIIRNAPAAVPVIDATVDAPFRYPLRPPVAREDIATINPHASPFAVVVDPSIDYDFTPRKPPTHRPESVPTIDAHIVLSDADEARLKTAELGAKILWRLGKHIFSK